MSTAKLESYGFEGGGADYDAFLSQYEKTLEKRLKRWTQEMEHGADKSDKTKRFIRKGIPSQHRAKTWMVFSGAQRKMQESPHLYRQLLEGPKSERLVETVNLDIRRTFPENAYFQDTEQSESKLDSLANVLVAFGTKNHQIGYTQGLNFVAGILLLVVQKEEEAFWLLDTIALDLVPGYHTPQLTGCRVDVEVLGELVKRKLPGVHEVLSREGVPWPLVVTKWFVCLYADVLPVETVLRVWDCMFYEGPKILLRVGVTLVKLNKQQILQSKSFPDIVEAFKSITAARATLFCHQFVESIFREPGTLSRSTIERLRETCGQRVTSQDNP